jgi:inosine-uridine nucleoside N-ribohydrolase
MHFPSGLTLLPILFVALSLAGIAERAEAADSRGAEQEQFILDTDIGDDIDDAYALALIAVRPDVKLIGVTTTYGQTHERAQVAAKLLQVMGRKDVPVFAGRPGPAKIGGQYGWAQGFQSPAIKSESAVDFMKRSIDHAPGRVTLIGIGALTNMGELVTRFPEVRSKIRRIVIMGGSVHAGYDVNGPAVVEWNIRCDPKAAQEVFSSGVPIVMAGLESTTMMQLNIERRRHIFAYGTPMTDALAALTVLWGGNDPTLFDPVAVAYALGHSDCDTEPQHIVVDDAGMTHATDGPPNTTLLVHPHKEAFLDWYVSALAPPAPK